MKNIKSLFIGLLFLTIGTSYAQTNRFDIGVEGSPSLISLRGNDYINSNHKTSIGYSGGIFFQYNFKKIISLRTNIAFERKGNMIKTKFSDLNGNPLGELKGISNYDYLILPILVRATFGRKIQYFINAGPYLGYLIKKTIIVEAENFPTWTSDDTYLCKDFDFGLTTGLGLLLPIKQKFALSLEVRNNLGLYNTSAVPVINNGTIKTNSTNFMINLVYKFGQRGLSSN